MCHASDYAHLIPEPIDAYERAAIRDEQRTRPRDVSGEPREDFGRMEPDEIADDLAWRLGLRCIAAPSRPCQVPGPCAIHHPGVFAGLVA